MVGSLARIGVRLQSSVRHPSDVDDAPVTKSGDPMTGSSPNSYAISAFTHPYHSGGPEIDQHQPGVKAVSLTEDGLSARIGLKKLEQGFVYELDLGRLRSHDKEELLHRNAFYTVIEIPSR